MGPNHFECAESLDLATIEGARALGADHEIGSLEVGKRADMILLDARSPNMNPIHGSESVISDLVYSASSGNVDSTIVDGQVLMEDRHIKSLDLAPIISKAHEISEKLARG